MVPRYIGLDLHARYIHGCEWTPEAEDGQKERHFRFPNTPDGWAQLLPQQDRTCWVALQVTGNRARLASSRRRAVNQAKSVLRRNGHLLPRKTDVRRWLTQDMLDTLSATDRVIVRSACRRLTVVETEIEEIEAELASCVAAVPAVQTLLTITGVGLLGAAATWAIVGDPHRFARGKQVTRYAGLDPSIVQSGDQRREGRISKTGSPLLRTLLVEAAHALARWDTGPLGQFYTRKARQVGPRKAIIALARKLLIVAWRMLLTGEATGRRKPRW